MDEIPTAEKFLKQVSPNYEFGLRVDLGNNKKHIYKIMCKFAKVHVEAALKEASEKAKIDYEYLGESGEFEDVPVYEYFVNKKSILNAYPLKNIK